MSFKLLFTGFSVFKSGMNSFACMVGDLSISYYVHKCIWVAAAF